MCRVAMSQAGADDEDAAKNHRVLRGEPNDGDVVGFTFNGRSRRGELLERRRTFHPRCRESNYRRRVPER